MTTESSAWRCHDDLVMCPTWRCCPLLRLLITAAVIVIYSLFMHTAVAANDPSCSGSLFLGPQNPIVEDGKYLTLNCTIQPTYMGILTSRDIYFIHGRSNYSSTSLDGRQTALLRRQWTIAGDRTAGGHIRCALPNCDSHMLTAVQHVVVVRQPLRPTVSSCHVLSWHSVTCAWQPSSHEQQNHMHTWAPPVHLVQWRIVSDNLWRDAVCLGDVSFSCTWNISSVVDQIHSATQTCVQVTPWIQLYHLYLSSTSALFCFVPALNVVVDKPRHLTESVTGDRWIELRWEVPEVDASLFSSGLVYSVTVLSEWAHDPVINDTMSDLSVSFELIPYSKYSASVRAKTSESRVWSASAVHNITTAPSRPRHSPRSSLNAFAVSHVRRYARTVIVYWQTLPARDHYGPRLNYIVQVRKNTPGWIDLKTVQSAQLACTDLNIDVDSDVELTVVARNQLGTTQPSVIWHLSAIDPDTPGDVLIQQVVELAGHHTVIWTLDPSSVPEGDSNVTLFWCRSQSAVSDQCAGDIQWLDLSASQTEHNLTLDTNVDPRQYSYGSAVRLASATPTRIGGIQWAHCVYNASGLARAVHGVKAVVPSHAKPGDVLVMWQHPECEIKHGHIKSLVLFYCRTTGSNSTSQCEDDWTEVSLPGQPTSFNLAGLDPGTGYLVWLYSVTRAGRSIHHSEVVTVVTSTPWLTSAVIAGLSVALVIFVLLAVVVVWAACKYCKRCHKKLMAPMAIAPPTSDVCYRASQTAYLPVVEYNRMSYQRQISRLSSSSHESGQFMMTPESNVSDSVKPLMMDNHRSSPQPSDEGSWHHLSPTGPPRPHLHNHRPSPQPSDDGSWHHLSHTGPPHGHNHYGHTAGANHQEMIPMSTYALNSVQPPTNVVDDDLDKDETSADVTATPRQPPAQHNGACEPVLPPTSDYIRHELLRL